MSKQFKKLSHTLYECKYHVVICQMYRYRFFEGEVEEYSRQQVYKLCNQKDRVEVLELNVQKDHIHVILSIPPKYSVSNLMGFLKGSLSTRLFKRFDSLGKRYWGHHLWSRGYCVSTVGLDEDKIRKYVRWQEKNDKDSEDGQFRTFQLG